jgi:hypothetical protein
MKANELRIGNYVCRKPHKVWIPFTVKDGEINEKFASTCNPIPLTEEWLLKFGFEENEGIFKIWLDCPNERTYLLHSPNDEYIEICRGGQVCCRPMIYYVHQLQNLYFALTGEELTIKH